MVDSEQFKHPHELERTTEIEGGKSCCGLIARKFKCVGCGHLLGVGTVWYVCRPCDYRICDVCFNLGVAEGGTVSTASLSGFHGEPAVGTADKADTLDKRNSVGGKKDPSPKVFPSAGVAAKPKSVSNDGVNNINNNNKTPRRSTPRMLAAENSFGLNIDSDAQALWQQFGQTQDLPSFSAPEKAAMSVARQAAGHLRFLELIVLSPVALQEEQNSRLKHRCLELYSPFTGIPFSLKEELISAARQVPEANRAMGALVGMAVGDACGAPFEFIDAVDREGSHRFDIKSWKIIGPKNKFKVVPGQWTDDTSMGLCLADTLLARGSYSGSDVRVRYHSWWFRGYNNAFGNHSRIGSVGLGGNVAQSLRAMQSGVKPSPIYEAHTQDAGNGTIMRLAAVPIFACSDAVQAAKTSAESSFATHPGPIAAAACAFQGFLIARAITRGPDAPATAADFLQQVVDEFIKAGLPGAEQCTELARLLASNEKQGGKEECWNWKAPKLQIQNSLLARGSKYNGYPCYADYFGSYCIDGLAVALWSFFHTTSYAEAIVRCTNFLGDADTTSAICGQIAGAFYGYDNIDQRWLADLLKWDDLDISCRGIMLWALQRQSRQE